MFGISKLEAYGIAALITLLAAFGWGLYQKHEGRVEGRAEVQVKFDAFVNDTKAAGLKAEDDRLKLQQSRDAVTAEQEKKHALEDAAIRGRYESVIAGMRATQAKGNSGGGQAKSLPQPADFSNDAAANKRLSDALFGYRQGVLGLFAKAEQQTRQLAQCQDWIKAQLTVK